MGAGASSAEASLNQNDPGKVAQVEAQINKTNPGAELRALGDDAKIASLSFGNNKSTVKTLVEEDPKELNKGTKSQAQIDEELATNHMKEWSKEFRRRRLSLHLIFREYDHDDSGAMEKEEFATMIHTILNEHLLESASHASDKIAREQAELILGYIDQDQSNSIDEMEFIEWIESGEKKSAADHQKFASKGPGQKLMVQFLEALVVRIDLVCGAIAMLFGDEGKMSKKQFLKMVLASGGETEGEQMNWGDEEKLWYQLQTMCRSTMKKEVTAKYVTTEGRTVSRGKELEDVLMADQIIDFLLVGYIVACNYRKQSSAEKTSKFSLNNPGGKSSAHRRLRRILGHCLTKKIIPALSQMNKELADDHIRQRALENWFSEFDKDESDVISKLQLFCLFTNEFKNDKTAPERQVLEKVYKECDEDGDNMCAKVEFVMWIERLLLSRKGRQKKDDAAELRKRLLQAAERRIEQMYQNREILGQLFRRYSDQQHLLNVEHMQFCLIDGRAMTDKEEKAMAEFAQFLVNCGQDSDRENVVEDEFVAYAIRLLCRFDVAVAQEKSKTKELVVAYHLRSRIKSAHNSKWKHCKLAIRCLFRHFVKVQEGKRLMTRHGFKHMMKAAFGIGFDDHEVAAIFNYIAQRQGVKLKKPPARVNEKPFVEYMSKGLLLSHEHKVVFGKRSACHRKLFQFLEALTDRQTQREHALQDMFVAQDADGSGRINSHELRLAFATKAATEDEELTEKEAAELLTIIDVNQDDELKREEFVDFFLDALAHTEANDKDWDKGLNPTTHDKVAVIMNRIMEELDNGYKDELMAAFDEFASFNIEESGDDMELLDSSSDEDAAEGPSLKTDETRGVGTVRVVDESAGGVIEESTDDAGKAVDESKEEFSFPDDSDETGDERTAMTEKDQVDAAAEVEKEIDADIAAKNIIVEGAGDDEIVLDASADVETDIATAMTLIGEDAKDITKAADNEVLERGSDDDELVIVSD